VYFGWLSEEVWVSMIISRTPLRISLGGGGTDLPCYYERFGGFVISAAINKYVFIGVNRTFTDDFFLKYSALERVKTAVEIKHPLIRESVRALDINPPLEIVSLADVPAGTGLGSSGAFTAGLLRALYALRREHKSARDIAEKACQIELDILRQPVGKQDQYIAAYGGLTCFEFCQSGEVKVAPLRIEAATSAELESHLSMFFTGYCREAVNILADQKARVDSADSIMTENLHFIKSQGALIKEALEKGDTTRFAHLMHEHWSWKRVRSRAMSGDQIDHWYEVGLQNGALGGKLVGAGGGGFLLFYAEDAKRLRRAMAEEGLPEMHFRFEEEGAAILARG
jgi:D-glycero-alpha-D-manno-heptose-7-phosphate kinase